MDTKIETASRCGGSRILGKAKRSGNKKKASKMTVSVQKGGSRMNAARHEKRKIIDFDKSKSGRRSK